MIIKVDESGYVTEYADVGGLEGGEDFSGEIPAGFCEDCKSYRLSNGSLVFDDTKRIAQEEKRKKAERIFELKSLLACTDYIAAKLAEGAATREEYADKLSERQSWRDEINELESL